MAVVERTCHYCGCPVNPDSAGTWRRITGWEHKATGLRRRGGSDIALRETTGEFACNACITILKGRGVIGQEALL